MPSLSPLLAAVLLPCPPLLNAPPCRTALPRASPPALLRCPRPVVATYLSGSPGSYRLRARKPRDASGILVSSDRTDPLLALLTPQTKAVLLASSGAGKSTLLNRLLGAKAEPVAPVRLHDHRGRHTHLPNPVPQAVCNCKNRPPPFVLRNFRFPSKLNPQPSYVRITTNRHTTRA